MSLLVVEGKANTHLTHLEELVLTQGPRGYDMARAFLLELLETLKGNSKSHVQTSVKWDGAPAIVAGINPENRKFFVGTKSVFNATPKINYTPEDIIKNHSKAKKDGDGNYERDEEGNVNHGGLVDKLLRALEELPKLGIKNILQGDFMFDDTMLSTVNIDGEPHYRFKPNTLIYTVPVDSELGQEIGRSRFGIVFHTTYDSLDSGAKLGADVSGLNRVPGIWFDDAFFTDDTGTVTLTENEERRILSLVQKADEVNNKIDYNEIPSDLLNIYINSEIKQGEFLESPEKSFEGFLRWYSSKIEARVEKLKSEKGKMRALTKGEEDLQSFKNKKEDVLNLFEVSRLLFEAKNIFISKYNNAVYNTKHFIDDGSGDLVATNPEGYVAVDHEGNGVKFVDRLEFSRANFMIDKGDKFAQNESFTVYWGTNGFSTTKTLREWSQNLPTTTNINENLFVALQEGTPITTLISEARHVKEALAAAVNWKLTQRSLSWAKNLNYSEHLIAEGVSSNREVVAIYPGRFQPMGRHHFQTYQELAAKNGIENTFIATSNAMGPNSPLTFEQKKSIMEAHGVPSSQIVQVRNPYYAKEIYETLGSPEDIEVRYFVGSKDMKENPRFQKTQGTTKEGYDWSIGVLPHVEIDVPGVGEMSGTSLRRALKSASREEFEDLMGWFDEEIYEMLQGSLNEIATMAGGSVALGPDRAPESAGSEKKKKRHEKNFLQNEELVNEVADYLLGISVG